MGKRTLVFDVETTGLSSYDRIVSIAGVWCDGFDFTGVHFYLVFNPRKACHPMAAAAHGLPDWWLRFQPPFEEFASDLRTLFDRAELVVGHNVGFDLRMINGEFIRLGERTVDADRYCTMDAYRATSAGGSAKLDACLSRIGLCRAARTHSAFEDTFLTMNLYRWLNGHEEHYALPSPAPVPTNATEIPKAVIWADLVDATPWNRPCSPVPECVVAQLARFGIEVAGHSPRTARMLLAAAEYASVLARRVHEKGSVDHLRGLICALADNDGFSDMLREWSRWAWGRKNPQLPHDELRAFAEEVLAESA
jgi:DNA polymerase-3 subunit epsilon